MIENLLAATNTVLVTRYSWPHLISGETEQERLYRAYKAAEELHQGHVPVSPELAEELCALLCQVYLVSVVLLSKIG